MRGSVFTILLILLMMVGFQVIAQGNGSVVITIDLHATQTADALITPLPTGTRLDPFARTATQLVVGATRTAIASGNTGNQNGINAQSVDVTVTEIVLAITPEPDESPVDTSMQSTYLSLAVVVIVIVIIGGAYALIASRIENR